MQTLPRTALGILVLWSAGNVLASPDSPLVMVYSRMGSPTPRTSVHTDGDWDNGHGLLSLGHDPVWNVMRNCPARNESALGSLNVNKDIKLVLFSGLAVVNTSTLCTNTGQFVSRSFDLAYEQASGDLMVAYWNDSTKFVGFRICAGDTISSESTLELPASSTIEFLTLIPKPGTNEIALLALSQSRRLYASIWNGDTWGDVFPIEDDTGSGSSECYAARYSSNAGELLLAYSRAGQMSPTYRTFLDGAWAQETPGPLLTSRPIWMRMANDPTSNKMIVAASSTNGDLNLLEWNGSDWGAVTLAETNLAKTDRRCFDVTFPRGGGCALVVYGEGLVHYVRYRSWDGATWSVEKTGPSWSQRISVVQLTPAVDSIEGIHVVASGVSGALKTCYWNGTTMGAVQPIDNSLVNSILGAWNLGLLSPYPMEQFMICTPARPRPKKIIRWREVLNTAEPQPAQ